MCKVISDDAALANLPHSTRQHIVKLRDFLCHHLNSTWEVYVCPFMNGDRPHLVLLNEFIGVQFIEVIEGSDRTLSQGDSTPLQRVTLYRDKLIDIYVSQIREFINKKSKALAIFAVGLYFPDIPTDQAKKVVDNEHCCVFGDDKLNTNSLDGILKSYAIKNPQYMQPEWTPLIRQWLVPEPFSPQASTEQIRYSGRINPKWEEIAKFPTPRTEGETTLAKALDTRLPKEWEIFVEPFVNGDRPDIVLLHRQHGVYILEVKDWQSGNYIRKADRVYVRSARGNDRIPDHHLPHNQLKRYIQTFYALANSDIGSGFPVEAINGAVYMHNMSTERARNLISQNAFGKDGIDALIQVITSLKTATITDDSYGLIRAWLIPPQHFLNQMEDLKFDQDQKRFSKPAPRKHQLLRGIAGSGKSLVLAQRAAALAQQGERVLVVSFNITLWHYLRDFVSRALRESSNREASNRITYTHFHRFCMDFLIENGVSTDQTGGKDAWFNEILPRRVLQTLELPKNIKMRQYDAILIDEFQDFFPLWYEVLCEFLSEKNQVFVVSDIAQNVYQRPIAFSQPLESIGILETSYRLTLRALEQSQRFAKHFFNREVSTGNIEDESKEPSKDIDLAWDELTTSDLPLETLYQTLKTWMLEEVHPSDVIVLVPTHEDGKAITVYFQKHGLEVNHVFDSEANETHKYKRTFEMGVGKVKVCTIHSFKGWELSNVMIVTPKDAPESWNDNVFYTALTRTKKRLVVFNRYEPYKAYGADWRKFKQSV